MTVLSTRSVGKLSEIPERMRQVVLGATDLLAARYPGILAVEVVGSLSQGCHDGHSDVDLVIVCREIPAETTVYKEVRASWNTVGFNFFTYTPRKIAKVYKAGTSEAWAIFRGLPVYDPKGVLKRYVGNKPPPPSVRWIRFVLDRQKTCNPVLQGTWMVLECVQILAGMRKGEMPSCKRMILEAFRELPEAAALHKAASVLSRRRPEKGWGRKDSEVLAAAVGVLSDAIRADLRRYRRSAVGAS